MVQWEDQYKDEYIDGIGDSKCKVSESVKKRVAYLEELNARKVDHCYHCSVKMRFVYTSNIYFKRQKIGSYCHICGSIKLWIRGD